MDKETLIIVYELGHNTLSYFLGISWRLTSWSHHRQRLEFQMEVEQTTTGLCAENMTRSNDTIITIFHI